MSMYVWPIIFFFVVSSSGLGNKVMVDGRVME